MGVCNAVGCAWNSGWASRKKPDAKPFLVVQLREVSYENRVHKQQIIGPKAQVHNHMRKRVCVPFNIVHPHTISNAFFTFNLNLNLVVPKIASDRGGGLSAFKHT